MKKAKLYTSAGKLGKHIEDTSIVATPTATAPGNHARIFDHDVFEIRSADPHALLGFEHRAHHLIVVVTVGDDA